LALLLDFPKEIVNQLPIYILHLSELVIPDTCCKNEPQYEVLDVVDHVVDAIDAYKHCDQAEYDQGQSDDVCVNGALKIIKHNGHATY
jgi:hypothetical protein